MINFTHLLTGVVYTGVSVPIWLLSKSHGIMKSQNKKEREQRVFLQPTGPCESNSIFHFTRPILLLWSPCFSYHFILQPRTLQSLTNTLKIKNPHHSKFYPCRSLEHKSIDKCPWTSKKCTNTIYTRQFFGQKFHFPLPNVIFTAALRDEWRHIF